MTTIMRITTTRMTIMDTTITHTMITLVIRMTTGTITRMAGMVMVDMVTFMRRPVSASPLRLELR